MKFAPYGSPIPLSIDTKIHDLGWQWPATLLTLGVLEKVIQRFFCSVSLVQPFAGFVYNPFNGLYAKPFINGYKTVENGYL